MTFPLSMLLILFNSRKNSGIHGREIKKYGVLCYYQALRGRRSPRSKVSSENRGLHSKEDDIQQKLNCQDGSGTHQTAGEMQGVMPWCSNRPVKALNKCIGTCTLLRLMENLQQNSRVGQVRGNGGSITSVLPCLALWDSNIDYKNQE